MNLCCLLHAPFEGLGKIADWIYYQGHACRMVRLYQGDELPPLDQVDWIIVMGGPMNVYEFNRHPWLRDEQAFLRQAVERKKTVLGVCLGAQLLAVALGARVYRNQEKEIGWHPVKLCPGPEVGQIFPSVAGLLNVFQWHGDTFDLPPDAIWLAESEACRHQAFVCHDRLVGLQFHLEITPVGIERLIANCLEDLSPGLFVQFPNQLLYPNRHEHLTNRVLWELLEFMERRTLERSSKRG